MKHEVVLLTSHLPFLTLALVRLSTRTVDLQMVAAARPVSRKEWRTNNTY